MKKMLITIVCCAAIFGGYYLFKNKNKLYGDYRRWKNSNSEIEKPVKETQPPVKNNPNQSQVDEAIATLSKTVEELSDYNKKLDEQLKSQADSITSLHVIIDSLGKELASKPKLKIQSSPYVNTNSNNSVVIKNTKPKNEKNLPIARGNTAVELKRFFTERYDNR